MKRLQNIMTILFQNKIREFRRSESGGKYKSYNTRTGRVGQVLYKSEVVFKNLLP